MFQYYNVLKNKKSYKCSYCKASVCTTNEEKNYPSFCPMHENEQILSDSKSFYQKDDLERKIALTSAKVESMGYCKWTRIEEIIQFAEQLGVTSIGIAHCVGLRKEAQIAHRIFEAKGFTVNSVGCKVGKIDKEELGLLDKDKVRPGSFEPACNPKMQAEVLDDAGCEMNVVVGLCVGHDSLFFMNSKVPTTVLIAKDRVTGHNPLAALNTAHSYNKHLVNID